MEELKQLFFNDDLLPVMWDWLIRLALALAIYVIGKWVARVITRSLTSLMNVRNLDETLVAFLGNLTYGVLLAAVILAALDSLGMPVTSLVALLGAAGLAVGLAMKDSLGNFAAGVMLILFRPFAKDDLVEVAGTAGKVEEIRIFNTVLLTADNKQVIIPNGQVTAATITNYTAKDTRRVDMVFGVGYDDDLNVARKALTEVCTSHPLVLPEPALSIFVLRLGDSSVDLAVRPWTRTGDYWTVWGDVIEQGKIALEAAGCSIPYPQRDLHLHQAATR